MINWNKYKAITTDASVIAPLIGKRIRGATDKFSYSIDSINDKRCIVTAYREASDSDISIMALPICLIDFMDE